jgi:hypothetical protein
VAREVVATRPNIILRDVELVRFPTGPVLVVSIASSRSPDPERIAQFEALLRERLGDQGVRVVVRVAESVDISSKGRVLFGEAHFGTSSGEEKQGQLKVEQAVRANLQSLPNTFVTAIDAVRSESGWAVRADVAAPRVLTPGDVRNVEERTAKTVGAPVDLTVRARTDILVTGKQYEVVGDARLAEEGDSVPTPETRSP